MLLLGFSGRTSGLKIVSQKDIIDFMSWMAKKAFLIEWVDIRTFW